MAPLDLNSVAPANAAGGQHLAWLLTAALVGWIAGTALQLQQRALWPLGAYLALTGLALVLGALVWRWRRWPTAAAVLAAIAAALMAFALAGGRATDGGLMPTPTRCACACTRA